MAVFGIGQGSTDGPPGWALKSDLIFKVYHWMSKGRQMADPTSTIKVTCNADMFVDNATLLHNKQYNTLATQLMVRVQHDAEV
eukprot:7925483-Ditylum_brightwellii.AAC.3